MYMYLHFNLMGFATSSNCYQKESSYRKKFQMEDEDDQDEK